MKTPIPIPLLLDAIEGEFTKRGHLPKRGERGKLYGVSCECGVFALIIKGVIEYMDRDIVLPCTR